MNIGFNGYCNNDNHDGLDDQYNHNSYIGFGQCKHNNYIGFDSQGSHNNHIGFNGQWSYNNYECWFR